MSGVLMVRLEDGITFLSDGMLSSGDNSPTLVGVTSKPYVLPHLPAIVAMTGPNVTLTRLMNGQATEWQTFDYMVENFRQAIGEQIEYLMQSDLDCNEVGARFFIGGFSEARQRWETYRMEVYAYFEDPWSGISELEPAPQLVMAPTPDVDALRRYGFRAEMKDGSLDLDVPGLADDVLMRLMRAQRATPIDFGLRSEGNWTPGHMVGFFAERIFMCPSFVATSLLWRWPDEIGKPIDASVEGWPVVEGKVMNDESEIDDSRVDTDTDGGAFDIGSTA